jgi:allantoate deiminase
MSGISAPRMLGRLEALARHSEQPDGLTRVYLSPEQRAATALVAEWMREAGMSARLDAIGNIVGRYEGERPGLPCLMLGSHLDTVRNAGKYDGMLGVVSAIECVRALNSSGKRLPFAVEVAGFADEEGVRFGVTLLGSRAIAGTFDPKALEAKDRSGTTLAEAMRAYGLDPARVGDAARRKGELLAYAELHIEQGPVLEAEGLAVGVVTAINGFSRTMVTLSGVAGHAGTVPMAMRKDALAAAAECVLAVERAGASEAELVATVGRIEALPGAINVIPGEARFSVDVRAPDDAQRARALARIEGEFAAICKRRGVSVALERLQDFGVTACAPWLMAQLERAIAAEGLRVKRLPSGAGHDGMAIGAIADIAMLFVRCGKGISHNPAEAITAADAETGARVLLRFIENFRAGPHPS